MIKVILADDHKLFREGLRALLERRDDIQVIGEAEDGRAAIDLARTLTPDVIVMDVGMPNLNGIEACRQIKAESPQVRIVALSIHSDRRFVAGMLSAGASGYLLKDSAFQELAAAICAAARDQRYLSDRVAALVLDDYVGRLVKDTPPTAPPLTSKEREVLQLLAEGKSTKEAALALNVSVKTVETHRQAIMDKLNLHSVAELTKYAVREGLTQL